MRAAVGSIIAHGALIAVLVIARGEREAPPRPEPELIEVVVVPPSPQLALGAPAGAPGARSAPGKSTTTIAKPARRTIARTRPTPTGTTVAELLATGAEVGFDDGGGGGDGDGGGGGGGAGGRGGLGTAALGSVAPRSIALPPPPKVSKARKAKLIYPSREREVEAGDLFIASVDVDDDGYVVGARMKSGAMGPRRDDAAGLIFKFRYLPALDDDGQPIRSTFDQPFVVGR